MKKWILIILGSLLLFGLIFLILIYDNESKALYKEVDYYIETGYYNYKIVSKGKYGKIEKLIKEDYKNIKEVSERLDGFNIENYFIVANYNEDSYDFKRTLEDLDDIKIVVERDFNLVAKIIQDEDISNRTNQLNLDDKYITKYKNLISDSKLRDQIYKIETRKNIIKNKITKGEDIIDLLLKNKNKWNTSSDDIIFSDNEFKNRYDTLINELKNM